MENDLTLPCTNQEYRNYLKENEGQYIKFMKDRNFDITNPKTIEEKLGYINIYEVNPLKSICADKINVHEYCKYKLGQDICIPIHKIYNNSKEIKIEELPNKFVLKCNHGSSMNIICKDKSNFNLEDACKKLNQWQNEDFSKRVGIEAHYHWIDRKIFAEEYKNDGHKDLIDYKFLCFNGKPQYCQVIGGRSEGTRHLNIYDMDFNFLDMSRKDFPNNSNIKDDKPNTFNLMKEYAQKLSNDFKFVRVDFYEINNIIYLGELTFTPGSCIFHYQNKKDEIKLGNLLDITKIAK